MQLLLGMLHQFIIAFDVRRTQHIILGLLWYSVGVPVVFKGDLVVLISSYVCIFCAILNNLSRKHKNVKTESTTKLSNFNSQWTKTLYKNNLKNIAFISTYFKG